MRITLLSLVLALAVIACSDVVTSTDVNRSASIDHGAISRGWLPEVLPSSARSITTKNNLDLNTSEAEFLFEPKDWAAFAASLQPLTDVHSPLADWPQTITAYRSRGYEDRSYRNEDSQWVFFCKPEQGVCKSYMWLVKPAAGAAR